MGGGGGVAGCMQPRKPQCCMWRDLVRVSDFRDIMCSLFPKAILFYFYSTFIPLVFLWCSVSLCVNVFIIFSSSLLLWLPREGYAPVVYSTDRSKAVVLVLFLLFVLVFFLYMF